MASLEVVFDSGLGNHFEAEVSGPVRKNKNQIRLSDLSNYENLFPGSIQSNCKLQLYYRSTILPSPLKLQNYTTPNEP